MRSPLLLFAIDLLLAAVAVCIISSCEVVGYKANCFGPPSPAQIDAGNAVALKMARP